jgi:aryl-alcohol dehydrogenase-like predicted oxidoreductase
MHWAAEDGTSLEEYWQVFTDLKREGKIRAAGLSNHDIFQLKDDDLSDIAAAVHATCAGTGPASPVQ